VERENACFKSSPVDDFRKIFFWVYRIFSIVIDLANFFNGKLSKLSKWFVSLLKKVKFLCLLVLNLRNKNDEW
jgi:hypothetical protein